VTIKSRRFALAVRVTAAQQSAAPGSRGIESGPRVSADPVGGGTYVSSMMTANAVVEVLAMLEEASVQVWLDGGWGVDALLGEQTRDHGDLDIILSSMDVPRLQEALLSIGFKFRAGGTATSFILADEHGREIDVHPIEFDQRGYGFFKLSDGRRWPFPPAAFAGEGRVGERHVRCLSADAQVQCHGQGYEPRESDFRDMERLQERFGVVLPVSLCRQLGGSSPAAQQPVAADAPQAARR